MKTKLIIFFMLLLVLTDKITAQSVDELIEEALSNNPRLQSLQYEIESAEWKVKGSDAYPAPSIGVEFSQFPGSDLNIWSSSLSQTFSITQMFPIGGKLSAMKDVALNSSKVSYNNYDIYKNDLSAKIKMGYYQLWFVDKKIELQNKNIQLLSDLGESINILYQVNKVSQADLLVIQSEIAKSESDLLILENDRKSIEYELNRLIGREITSASIKPVSDFDIAPLALSTEEYINMIYSNNPSLSKMTNMLEMNKSELTANNKELIPDLMVGLMVMRMPRGMLVTTQTNPVMLPMEQKTNVMYGLMFSFNLPFAPWSVGKYTAKEAELQAAINSIDYARTDMEREMTAKVRQSLEKLKTYSQLEDLYKDKVIPLYTESKEAQITAYQNNLTNINMVIDSHRMLIMQEMNYYMAKADYQMVLAEIEMMIGQSIQTKLTEGTL